MEVHREDVRAAGLDVPMDALDRPQQCGTLVRPAPYDPTATFPIEELIDTPGY